MMADTRVFPDQGWDRFLDDIAKRINAALAAGDRAAAAVASRELFQAIEQEQAERGLEQIELHVKASRNELTRVYALHGWYEQALQLQRAFLDQPPAMDATSPNREAMVRETIARLHIEAEQLDLAQRELEQAVAASLAYRAQLMEAWAEDPAVCRAPRGPAGPPPPGGG